MTTTFKNTLQPLLLTIGLIVSSQLFISSAVANSEKEKLPIFKVEIIVFQTLALRGWTEEYWPVDPEIIDTEDAIVKRPLARSQNMLNSQVAKMTSRAGYKVLFHQSWLVQAVTEKNAKPILILVEPNRTGQARLEGSIKFYKSRHPHVITKLELEQKIPTRIREKLAEHQQINLEDLPEYWRFNINESKRINSNQLHYLDHPLFGALIQIQYQPE